MSEARPVDVLDFAAGGAGGGRRRALRWAVVSLAVAIVLGAGAWLWHWWQESAPTLTRAEVGRIYDLPIPAAPGARNWDPSTKLVQTGGDDIYDPGVEPLECTGALNPDVPPVSADVVSVNLTPVVRSDGGQVFSGTIETYRYLDPAAARDKYRILRGILSRCPEFSDQDDRFTIDQLAAVDDGFARSELSFRLRDGTSAMRITLVRFANTVTWITTPDEVDATPSDDVNVPDLLVARMQEAYRAR